MKMVGMLNRKIILFQRRSVINQKKNAIVNENLLKKILKLLYQGGNNDRDKTIGQILIIQIEFAPKSDVFNNNTSKHGYINRAFNNVISIELCQVIIPRKTQGQNDSDDYPYIIISIDEFDGVYQGTNDVMNKAF